MRPKTVHVYIDLTEGPLRVGTLWPHMPRAREGHAAASFEYDPAWLVHPARFALEPALSLGPGAFHTSSGKALFGSLGDSAPDRWGRTLMDRAAAERARAGGHAPPTLLEIDYLLGVTDATRSGALRFACQPEGPFLAVMGDITGASAIPPLVDLPALLRAADAVLDDQEDAAALRLLVAPGSSLGGARPKASVRDANLQLAIAKFPAHQDAWDVVRWEGLALALAERAGLRVPRWRIEQILDGRPVLIVERFDRRGTRRIPFLSAMSMLGAIDNETRSYLEIADALREHGATTGADLRELWCRIVFTVLISNTDDHLRNHGFLYDEDQRGWRLAPVYDINPTPRSVKPRILSLAIDERNTTASLSLALDVAEYFDIPPADARAIASAIRVAVQGWRAVARALGLSPAELSSMETAFEHEDLLDT